MTQAVIDLGDVEDWSLSQDHIELGGLRSPGRATLKGLGSPRKWDEQKGYGLSGATLVYTGDGLSKFTVEVYLWTKEQERQWADFARQRLAKAPKGAKATAWDIQHPDLTTPPHAITSVVVEDVVGPVRDEYGAKTWEIKLTQFRAPQPAIGKPKSSSKVSPLAKKAAPTAKDAADLQIEKLTAKLMGLAR